MALYDMHKPIRGKRPGKGWIYAFLNRQTGLVKIGFTTRSPVSRAKAITAISGCDIDVLGYRRGRQLDELAAHIEFADCRRRGEWFEQTPELACWIAVLGEAVAK